MSKISGVSPGHHNRPQLRAVPPFDRLVAGPDGRNPVDVAVESRVGNQVRQKWIIKFQDRILELLGKNHANLYLKLEAKLNEQSRDRERCFYNVGFEHGVAEGAAASEKRLQGPPSLSELLVRDLLQRIIEEQVPANEVTAALLRGALSIVDSSQGR